MYGKGIYSAADHPERTVGTYCIEAVASWCQAVQGGIRLTVALKKICDAFGGELAAVTRIDHSIHVDRTASTRIVAFDRRANLASDISGYRVPCAKMVCGEYFSAAKLGSVWHAHVSDFGQQNRISRPLAQRRLVETIVIPLAHHANSSDFLEMHFPSAVHAAKLDNLELIGATLATAWKSRSMGLLVKSCHRNAHSDLLADAKSGENTDLLAVDNPCRLSRAEYRVCVLLSSGLNNEAILDELSIGISTLRTHLRNIYAKTETASQPELLQRLMLHAEPGRTLQSWGERNVA